jgi:hypothetical protein
MTDETESATRHKLEVSRAWKRLVLDENGALHADGKLVLRDLMKHSQFFGTAQYALGNHDKTLELAVRRQLVTHILACVWLSADDIIKKRNSAMEQVEVALKLTETYRDG